MMELSTTYDHQTVFCLEPSQRISKFSFPLHRSNNPMSAKPTTENCSSNHHFLQHQAKYIQNVAGDLHFCKEVVKDRGLSSLPYVEWDSQSIYNISDVIPLKKGKKCSIIQPKHHKICHLNCAVPLKDMKSRSCPVLGKSIWKKPRESVSNGSNCLAERPKASAVTGLAKVNMREKPSFASESEKVKCKGNEVLLKMSRKAMAQGLLAHSTEQKEAKEKFCQQYGLNKTTVLINEDRLNEDNVTTCNELERSKLQSIQVVLNEKKAETLLPVYYK